MLLLLLLYVMFIIFVSCAFRVVVQDLQNNESCRTVGGDVDCGSTATCSVFYAGARSAEQAPSRGETAQFRRLSPPAPSSLPSPTASRSSLSSLSSLSSPSPSCHDHRYRIAMVGSSQHNHCCHRYLRHHRLIARIAILAPKLHT